MSRIGRHSRKIDFSFISPKHTFGWTYSRKNSLKFQRFILRPKFEKVQTLHIMMVQNFMLLYGNSGGIKTILWKRNLAQILFHSYTLKSCNKFLEVLFVAFWWRYLYSHHLRLLARNNLRPTLTSINGLWYISFGQNIYILGYLGYCFFHPKSYSCGN